MDARRAATAAAGILLAVAACAPAPRKSTGRLRVVTTIGVLADWVRQVGGARVEATSLLSGYESPHTYEIRPADVKTIADARILFRVGLGMEEWRDPAIENSGSRRLVVVDAANGVAEIITGDEHDRAGNPHIWLDPELARSGIARLVEELVRSDPKGESLYRAREAAYFGRLDSLSAAISAGFAGLSDRRLITYHDAWPYFARRFGLDIVATIEPIPGQQPSAKELARLVDLIRREQIKVITTEPQLPSVLPDMLARETGVKVVVLNPLESEGGYIAALGKSASALINALR
jgi:manganese/iron transport system substrate-binding protein